MKRKLSIVIAALIMLLVIVKTMTFTPELVSLSGPTMGTTYTVKFFTTETSSDYSLIKEDVDVALVRVNKLMSTYDPDSELSRFNALPAGAVREISGEFAYVLDKALLISRMSSGEYDVTVGPLVNLWGFGPVKKADVVPSETDIEAAKALVGYQYADLQGTKLTKLKDIYIDLSSIAKGYGVDVVADVLEQHGITQYLIEVGGEIRSKGLKADGEHWRIAIESPSGGHNVIQKVIAVKDVAVATSGDYRNYFEKNGVRYSHTINPLSGRPITHRLVSVTIIAETATMADGLATAITVLGPEKGLAFAEENGIAAYLLVKQDFGFVESASSAFKPYMTD